VAGADEAVTRAVLTYRWAPVVDNVPHLEYGLWKHKVRAVRAAQEIVSIRTGGTHASAVRVYYRIDPLWQKKMPAKGAGETSKAGVRTIP